MITKDMIIRDVIRRYPETINIFGKLSKSTSAAVARTASSRRLELVGSVQSMNL